MNINIEMSLHVLAQVVKDVRKHVPGVQLRKAWVYKLDRDHWEFHYEDFYWHGDADNAYEARAEGWSAYLEKRGVEGYTRTEVTE